jgi:biopolymer transport protein ExbB
MLSVLASPLETFHNMRALGGPVVNYIFLACVLMWSIVIERYWYYRQVLPSDTKRMLDIWAARNNRHSWTSHQVRRAMISRLNAGMAANMQVLRVLVPMCPLLGLLGTVGGMLEVFDSMAARGSADARSMASGISEAMICTLSGLAVSITGLYPVYYFRRRMRHETELLAEKFTY